MPTSCSAVSTPPISSAARWRSTSNRVRRAFEARRRRRRSAIRHGQAALGVQRIVDETMAAATRMHLAEKGRDPRRYTLIAFGGAGPVHAWNLARLLKIEPLVVPLGAGVASALGFLVAPPATDMVRSYVARLERHRLGASQRALRRDGGRGPALLTEAGADADQHPPSAPSPTCATSARASRSRSPCPASACSACRRPGDPRHLLRQLSRPLRPHRRGEPDRGAVLAPVLRRAGPDSIAPRPAAVPQPRRAAGTTHARTPPAA